MRRIWIGIGSYMLLKLLSLRYKIEVKGLDLLQENKGLLFLPNHPAEIEPIIVYSLLARKFRPRAFVIEHFYYLRGARFFMNLVRALPMPNFELSANSWKIRQVEKCLEAVVQALKKGENFLIYPSGRLKREGQENIGGNSFIHSLLTASPDANIVLVRTSGLWGSLFSCAFSKESPNFWAGVRAGVKVILKNGIFFTPRRKVTVEFKQAAADFPRKGNRLELNRYLENWYNQYLLDSGECVYSEPLQRVSYSCFSKVVPILNKEKSACQEEKKLDIPTHIRSALYQELKKISGAQTITEDMDLARDLGLDSLDLANIYTFIDQKFEVEATHLGALKTVYDLLSLIVEKGLSKSLNDMKDLTNCQWPEENIRPEVTFPDGKTIPECFLKTADRMGKAIACGDEVSKTMSYREMKLKILIIAQKLRKVPEKYIGVLLPSSVGCNLIVLSILFAGKIPVMLNWTAGKRGMNLAKELLGLKTVLSSRRFLERVDVLELGELESHLVLLEDFYQGVSTWNKLSGLYFSWRKKAVIYKKFALQNIKEEDPCVILFTSGTESYPKAVPLSHKNILSNQKAALQCVDIYKEDILYGVLPPFHSFGFSVTGVFPLLVGVRIFYAPNVTDSRGMAWDCFHRKITLLCCAPSFYRNLFRVATPHQFKSVRLFVTGAEKATPELFEYVECLGGNKEMIEGYGITECSPLVTINRQKMPRAGVGQPAPGVELCFIHPETNQKLPPDQQGEICIRGPNVFSGYFGKNVSNPFIEVDGKKWYRSGDLGHIAPDGSLILGGRLKRFVKIGGEMVSLIALEESILAYALKHALITAKMQEPQLVVGVKEGDKPELILFTTFRLEKDIANKILKEDGFARIIKFARVCTIGEIPMTGSGKVHLKKIEKLIEEMHD